MPDGAIYVKGLDQLLRDLGRMAPELRKELRGALREAAGAVSSKAKQIAESEGLRASGALIRLIKPSVRGSRAYVVESATRTEGLHAPFRYPAVFEFGQGGARSFLRKAAEEELDHTVARVGAAWTHTMKKLGF